MDRAAVRGALYSQGLSTPKISVPLVNSLLSPRVAGSGCQTAAGNARITNELLVSLGDKEAPANKGSGHCERLLGPPAGERP